MCHLWLFGLVDLFVFPVEWVAVPIQLQQHFNLDLCCWCVQALHNTPSLLLSSLFSISIVYRLIHPCFKRKRKTIVKSQTNGQTIAELFRRRRWTRGNSILFFLTSFSSFSASTTTQKNTILHSNSGGDGRSLYSTTWEVDWFVYSLSLSRSFFRGIQPGNVYPQFGHLSIQTDGGSVLLLPISPVYIATSHDLLMVTRSLAKQISCHLVFDILRRFGFSYILERVCEIYIYM